MGSSSTQHLPSGCKEIIFKKQCSISSASSFFHSCSQLLKRRAFSSTSASERVAKDGIALSVISILVSFLIICCSCWSSCKQCKQHMQANKDEEEVLKPPKVANTHPWTAETV